MHLWMASSSRFREFGVLEDGKDVSCGASSPIRSQPKTESQLAGPHLLTGTLHQKVRFPSAIMRNRSCCSYTRRSYLSLIVLIANPVVDLAGEAMCTPFNIDNFTLLQSRLVAMLKAPILCDKLGQRVRSESSCR